MSEAAIVSLLIMGLLLMIAEVFVIPGFGIAGVLSLVALTVGSWGAYTELGEFWGGMAAAGSLLSVALILYIFPKTRAGKALVHGHTLAESTQPARTDLMHRQGQTTTPLRPSGRALFGQEEIDIISDGEYLDAGENVVVVAVDGTRVVVQKSA